MNNAIQQKSVTYTIPAVRNGWLGVWDALVSAITRRRRVEGVEEVTFSVWVRGEAELYNAQAESSNK